MSEAPPVADALTLNIRAMLALRGVGKEWRTDILALLDSDMPIDRMFRDELAKVIRGESGIKLTLTGHKPARDASVGAIVRFEYMEIGRWVEMAIGNGDTRDQALGKAASTFCSSREKCDEALMYYQKATRWLDCAQTTEIGSGWPRDILESMYHAREGGSPYIVGINREAFDAFDAAYRTSNGISGDAD